MASNDDVKAGLNFLVARYRLGRQAIAAELPINSDRSPLA